MTANLSSGTVPRPYGKGGRRVYRPLTSAAQVWQGAMVSEISGSVVTATTGGSGAVTGIAEMDGLGSAGPVDGTDDTQRISVLYDGIFTVSADGSSPPTDATPFGTVLYAASDHTVTTASNDFPAGRFVGMTDDGDVLMFINASGAAIDFSDLVLSSATPQALGVAAAAGSSGQASDAGHEHAWAQSRKYTFVSSYTGSADTNGTPNTPINVGAVLPAGAYIVGVDVDVTSAATINSTLLLKVGWSGAQTALVDGLELISISPGHYDQNGAQGGSVTAAGGILPLQASGKQVTFTLTPDSSSKLSAEVGLAGTINVYYVVPF